MKTMVELATSILVESKREDMMEGFKDDFRPMDKNELAYWPGAESNKGISTPMTHEHEHGRIMVGPSMDTSHGFEHEDDTVDVTLDHSNDHSGTGGIRGSFNGGKWKHAAKMAKAALDLHGEDHQSIHKVLEKHGFYGN